MRRDGGREIEKESESRRVRERERSILLGVGNEVGGMCENGGESWAGNQVGCVLLLLLLQVGCVDMCDVAKYKIQGTLRPWIRGGLGCANMCMV